MVVVGSLDKQLSTTRYIDRDLQPYYNGRPSSLTAASPHSTACGSTMWRSPGPKGAGAHLAYPAQGALCANLAGLPQWPYVQQDLLAAQRFALQDRTP